MYTISGMMTELTPSRTENDGLDSVPPAKLVETAVPGNLKLQVLYLHEGRCSGNQLKKVGRTNTKYVTLARLYDKNVEPPQLVAEGLAACSAKDNPNRKIGRAVAVGRALARYYYGE